MSTPAPEAPGTSSGLLTGQMIRFALVGVVATCAHYLVAMGAVQYVNVYGANLAGYLAAVAISYFGHQRFSFQRSSREISHRAQFPRFLLASLGGLILSYLVLAVMETGLAAPHWLSLAAAVCLVPIYTFLVNKLCVFQAEVKP
jgi:putative flippase GtrA